MMTKIQITKIGLAMVLVLCAGSALANHNKVKFKTLDCANNNNKKDKKCKGLESVYGVKGVGIGQEHVRETGVIKLNKTGAHLYTLEKEPSVDEVDDKNAISFDETRKEKKIYIEKITKKVFDDSWSCKISGSGLLNEKRENSFVVKEQDSRYVLIPPHSKGKVDMDDEMGGYYKRKEQYKKYTTGINGIEYNYVTEMGTDSQDSSKTAYPVKQYAVINNVSNEWKLYGEYFYDPGLNKNQLPPAIEVSWTCERDNLMITEKNKNKNKDK